MAGFINKYNKGFHAYYDVAEFAGDGVYAVGLIGDKGLITKTDFAGNLIWDKSYSIGTGVGIRFLKVIRCDNGDAMLLGTSNDYKQYSLTRVSPDGTQLWSRYYKVSDADSYHAKIASYGNEQYILQIDEAFTVPGGNTVAKINNLVFKVDADGDFLAAMNYEGIGPVVQIRNIASNGSSIVLYGIQYDSTIGIYSLILFLDSDLKLIKNTGLKSFKDSFGVVYALGIEAKNGYYFLSGSTRITAGSTVLQGFITKIDDQPVSVPSTLAVKTFTGHIGFTTNGDDVYIYNKTGTGNKITRTDDAFTHQWTKQITSDTDVTIEVTEATGSDMLIRAYFSEAYFGRLNLDMESCKTVDLSNTALIGRTIYGYDDYDILFSIVNAINPTFTLAPMALAPTQEELCPVGIPVSPLTSYQSPHLYLQAAGSTAQDGSAKGIHLRWILRRALGEKHLPKGNYASSTANFNKPNDFVKVHRIPYFEKPIEVSFETSPTLVDDSNQLWLYEVDDEVIYVYFRNVARYNSVRASINPLANPTGFLNSYGDEIIEVENKGNLAFSVRFKTSGNAANSKLEVETLSVEENKITAQKNISIRRTITGAALPGDALIAENIRSVRFRGTNVYPTHVYFELYHRVLAEANAKDAVLTLGEYALTTETSTALTRLEPTPNLINGKWQRYNDNAYVNIANYIDRWDGPTQGAYDKKLVEMVDDYIQLSNDASNPYALEMVSFSDDLPEGVTQEEDDMFEISYLALLQLASMDYHIARMMGLGEMDLQDDVLRGGKFLYIAEYKTFGDLEDGNPAGEVQHLYMSLPTTMQDQRLPVPVDLKELAFGIYSNVESGEPSLLTDEEGYTQDGKSRFITLYAKEFTEPYLDYGFYYSAEEFDTAAATIPVYAGIEYKKEEIGENMPWRKPELPNTPDYQNLVPAGQTVHNETVPIPIPDPLESLFVHRERETGRHIYSSYGINWFSRMTRSAIEKIVITDIQPQNQLLPPSNINPLLIVDEGPLLLTTANEQVLLDDLQADTGIADKTLIRLTFDYHSYQDLLTYKITDLSLGSYSNPLDPDAIFPDSQEVLADEIDIFFREEVPTNVSGKAKNIIDDNSNNLLSIIRTETYQLVSTGQEIVPTLDPALMSNFVGGVFVLENREYIIHEVTTSSVSGEGPIFKVFKKEITDAIQTGVPTDPTADLEAPEILGDGLFMAIENMLNPGSWGAPNPYSFKIQIGDNWPIHREVIEREGPDDGLEQILEKSRGFWEDADITLEMDLVDAPDPDDPPLSVHLGVYKATFDTLELDHHPQFSTGNQNSVDWYKGIIRVHTLNDPNGPRKTCEVLYMENVGVAGEKLVVYFVDASFPYPYDNSYEPIETGSAVEVNFYPGYRTYLYEDQTLGLTESTILPAEGEGVKYTVFGLRSVDLGTSPNYTSKISVPKMMFAQEIVKPQQPELPIGVKYATRPDRFGRSTYTFTTQFAHAPHAALFFRTNEEAILTRLYTRATIDGIRTALKDLNDTQYIGNRWSNLIGFDYTYANNDPVNSDGEFGVYPPDATGYRLPNPDNPDLFEVGESPGSIIPGDMIDRLIAAVYDAFVPLTGVPLIYQYIREEPYQPTRNPQVIRDRNGYLIPPSLDPSSEFDIAPMAKRMGTNQVLFTDFTLDGTSENVYFYSVREMGSTMQMGEYSPIWGAISLVNTAPPQTPEVKRVMPVLENPALSILPGVQFEINSYPDAQHIKKINLYRTFEPQDALSVRTMELVDSYAIDDLGQATDSLWVIKDEFVGVDPIPYGDPLMYKITVSREVEYADKDGMMETGYAPSEASKLLMSNVVEIVNPIPPEVSYTSDPINANFELKNVELSWPGNTYNGIYRLSIMNENGGWVKIYEVQTKDDPVTVLLANTNLANGTLLKQDADGNTIYHKFKIDVENTGGLFNLEERISVI